jgi:AcrR family transcriptional regulator
VSRQFTVSDQQRAGKTEQAVIDAFKEMVLRERYDDIRVGEIVRESDVGRSTFYDHFRDKDDVLVKSMAGLFRVLAGVIDDAAPGQHLEQVLNHFEENRNLARSMFSSPSMQAILRALAQEMTRHLPERLSLPASLIAMQLAEAEMSLIRSWLTSDVPVTSRQLAEAIRVSLRGMLEAYQA